MSLDTTDIERQTHSPPLSTVQSISGEDDALERVVVVGTPRISSAASDREDIPDQEQTQTPTSDHGNDDVHGNTNAVSGAAVSEQPLRDTSAPSTTTAVPVAGNATQPPVNAGNTGHSRQKRTFFGMNRTDGVYGAHRLMVFLYPASG